MSTRAHLASPSGLIRTRRRTVLAAIAAGALVLTGCGGGDPAEPSGPAPGAPTDDATAALEAAAKAEGGLTFYTSVDEKTAQDIADAFGEKYGIDATFTRMPSGPLTARYTAEAEAGSFAADVVMMTEKEFISDAVAKGWMIDLTDREVPNLATLPDSLPQEHSAPIGIAVKSSMVVNTDKVPEADLPTEWADLLDPRWKGQLFEQDARASGVWLAVADLLADTFGDDYVRQLRAQQTQFVDSLVNGVQLVAAGERAGALGATETHLNPLLEQAPDAPVKLVRIQDLQFGYEWATGVSAKSAHPNAGKLFVNWLLSEEGQREFNKNVGNSIFPDIEIEGFEPISDDFVLLDLPAAEQDRARLLSLLGLPE